MRFVDGAVASKIFLSLGIAMLVAERLWIPAAPVFWCGLLFCTWGLRRSEVFDVSPVRQ
jgi:hypothetical protein